MEILELEAIEIPEFLPVTKQSGIEKAEQYAATFAPFMITLKELSNKCTGINKNEPTALDAKLAREVRLALVKNRTATAKKKDESKAALLAESNLIQNLHNVVVNTSQLIEADMEAIEKHAERKEKERIEAIRIQRVELLDPYVEDANIFPLGSMSEDAFTELITGSKLAFDARVKAEQEAEQKRIAEENARLEEQKRIREENERLRAEAEEKEKQLADERAEAKRKADELEAENKAKIAAIEESNRIAREKAAAEQKKKDDAAAAELKKQKEAADKISAELKTKQDAEAAELKAKIDAEKKAQKAPDKTKLKSTVELLTLGFPEFKTKEAQAVADNIRDKFSAFKKWANDQIETL